MRLRVQKEGTPGYMSVDSFQKESLLSQFLQFLSTQLDISLARVQLSSTHPRRTIQSELDCTLETVGIRSGDTLVAGESAQAFSPFFPFLLPKVEDDEVIVVDDENGDDDGGERVPSYAKETFGVDFLHTVEPGLLAEGDDNALFVVRRKVEADNSCLFHAVAIAIGCAYVNAIPYRTAVADMVIRHASELDEGILEKKPEEYAKWIVNEEKWGGEIEAMILAKWVFHIEIALVDVRTASMHVYGQSRNVKHRVYLLYNGIHYDPLALNPVKGAKVSFCRNDNTLIHTHIPAKDGP
eukprot:TRINITY_DN1826_c0_g1_i3.p1 TRINITY_DN1826_c0_g1~~TRINITY_DN1826_c0_g1_i3.p1  ORF type:complete len:296 (+),score=85.21 TRINITY_DN1826_c0_g1_i3:110-997(+)